MYEVILYLSKYMQKVYLFPSDLVTFCKCVCGNLSGKYQLNNWKSRCKELTCFRTSTETKQKMKSMAKSLRSRR